MFDIQGHSFTRYPILRHSRFLKKPPVEFEVSFKLWILTNHLANVMQFNLSYGFKHVIDQPRPALTIAI